MRNGHECVVFDVNPESIKQLEGEGASGGTTLEEFVGKLEQPRAVWVMIPAGITGRTVDEVAALLDEGDIIIDGGNSNYRDDVRRATKLREKGIHYVDVGTSGGVFGLERGYCLMVGGDEVAIKTIEPDPQDHRPGTRRDRADTRPQRRPGPGGAGLPALRAIRGRALRQDGAQRHRVRHHGRLRRGPEHPGQRRRRNPVRRALRRDRADGGAGVLPVRHQHRQGDRAVAARIGGLLLAARPHRGRTAGQPHAGRPGRPGLGLRRGSLDGQSRGGHRRTRSGARRVAVRAVRVPRRGPVRQPGALGDAAAVRRPQGAAGWLRAGGRWGQGRSGRGHARAPNSAPSGIQSVVDRAA